RPSGACEKSSQLRQPFRAALGGWPSPRLRGAGAFSMFLAPGNANFLIGAYDVKVELAMFRCIREKRELFAVRRPRDVVFLVGRFSVACTDSFRGIRRTQLCHVDRRIPGRCTARAKK